MPVKSEETFYLLIFIRVGGEWIPGLFSEIWAFGTISVIGMNRMYQIINITKGERVVERKKIVHGGYS